MFAFLLLSLLNLSLSSCSIGYLDTYKPKWQSSDTSKYKRENRLYTENNIEYVEKTAQSQGFNHMIVNRSEALSMNKLINDSKQFHDNQNKEYIENYITNYNEMIDNIEQKPDEQEKVVSKDYFIPAEYGKQRPVMNGVMIKYFRTNGVVPMTKETEDIFKNYYAQHNTNNNYNVDNEHFDVESAIPADKINPAEVYDVRKPKKQSKKDLAIKIENKSTRKHANSNKLRDQINVIY